MQPGRTLLASLSFCVAVNFGALSAAEIQIIPEVTSGQSVILVSGPIEEGDDSRFFEVAEASPRALVLLESPGGLVKTGISIAAEIAIQEYSTLVLDGAGCHSICAIMWTAGKRRYMSPDASISVHAAYEIRNDSGNDIEIFESGMANAQIGAFLNEIGLSAEAIRYFSFAGPSEETLEITPEIAQALSLDVYIQTPDGTITPAERPTPRRITRQVSEYAGLSGNCSNIFRVDGAFWEDQAKSILNRGHDIFGGNVFSRLLGQYTYETRMAIEELGFVRWCLAAERNLRQEGLRTGILGPSFDCSKSSTLTEFRICSHPDLWAMDRAMANLYFYFRDNSDAYRSQEFLSSQRSWLARRDQCLDDFDCLYERYSSRLFDFGV